MDREEVKSFFKTCSTIGAYIVFPGNKVNGKLTINGARGLNGKIGDRFDLTLECIRLHYLQGESPLSETLKRYSGFFDLFGNFRGYVKFFLLEDLVSECFEKVKFHLPFDDFTSSPYPSDLGEYNFYKKNVLAFVTARNRRIEGAIST